MSHPTLPPADEVSLRDVTGSDLPIFYEQQLDPEAVLMADYPSRNWPDFSAHWGQTVSAPGNLIRTIVFNGQVAGNILSFQGLNYREVGYWLGRDYWNRGIATRALTLFIAEVEPKRPLAGYTALEHFASQRVLLKCGFKPAGFFTEQLPTAANEVKFAVFVLE